MRRAALSMLFAGCGGDAEYRLELLAPDDLNGAVRVEVDVLRSGCDLVPPDGFPITDAEIVRALGWHLEDGTSEIGNLVPMRYGFYARLRREDCSVGWAGCAAREIEEDGEGLIQVELESVEGAVCLPEEVCEGLEGCFDLTPED